MVSERADLEVLAGCRGRPFGGERTWHYGNAVAIRGDFRPRAEVRVARVDLDVLGGVCTRECTTVLPVSAAPGVVVVKREDEVDVVVAVHAVVSVRVE